MPDLSMLLAAEAERRQPLSQPAFDGLVRARRQRDRRRRAAATAVLAVAGGGVAMTLLGTDARTPAGPTDEVKVTGELREVGGPAPGVVIRARGDVVFEATDGERTSVPTDEQGRFSTALEPGEYTVTGSSPEWNRAEPHVGRTGRPSSPRLV